MSVFARDSRKMFSMFKSIDSIYDLSLITKQNNDTKTSVSTFELFTHLTKSFYYLFDNLQFLCGFNLLPFNKGYVNHLALLFYTANILCSLWKNVQNLYSLNEKRQGMIHNNDDNTSLNKINNDILICFIESTAKISDLISAFNAFGLSELLFNTRCDTLASIGGIYSGVISLWKTFSKASNVNKNKQIPQINQNK